MTKVDSNQHIEYVRLAKWFFFSGSDSLRKRLSLLVVMTVFGAFSESISLVLIVPVLHALLPADAQSGMKGSETLSKSVDFITGIVPENLEFLFARENRLISLLALIALLVAAKTVLNLVANWQAASCQWELMAVWSKGLLKSYLEKDYLSFLNYKHGKMLGNIVLETRIAAHGVRDAISSFSQLILSIAFIGLLFITNWRIALFQLAAIVVLASLTRRFVHHRTTKISREIFEAKQETEATASESLAALRQIKASATENDIIEKFGKAVDEMAELMKRHKSYSEMPKPLSEFLIMLLIVSTIYYLYLFTDVLVASNLPTLALLILIANRLFVSLAKMASSFLTFTSALPAMEMISKMLEQKHGADSDGPGQRPVDLTKDIVFANIGLRYPGKSQKVLDDLNLTVKGGKVTALVGPSGAGKSTIIDLILGFIQPDDGNLYLDGQDAAKLDYSNIRKKIGYVSQEVFLFNCSIRDNLLFHRPEATESEIEAACEKAGISKVIEGLPEKYDTIVGDRGVMLSGGERQRLAIAIAVLRDSELIIFDEATNALDTETEAAVHRALRELRDKTMFYVTHRISPALQPDHIYKLENGKVREIDGVAAV